MTLHERLTGLVFAALLASSFSMGNSQITDDFQAEVSKALGNWSFKSVPYRDDTCQMSGTMQIRPNPESGTISCAFTAVEDCIGEDRWIVEQVCSIETNGRLLSMKSSITNFIEADDFTGSYAPDHFLLTVESASRMSGQIISAISADVEFTREEDAVS